MLSNNEKIPDFSRQRNGNAPGQSASALRSCPAETHELISFSAESIDGGSVSMPTVCIGSASGQTEPVMKSRGAVEGRKTQEKVQECLIFQNCRYPRSRDHEQHRDAGSASIVPVKTGNIIHNYTLQGMLEKKESTGSYNILKTHFTQIFHTVIQPIHNHLNHESTDHRRR